MDVDTINDMIVRYAYLHKYYLLNKSFLLNIDFVRLDFTEILFTLRMYVYKLPYKQF